MIDEGKGNDEMPMADMRTGKNWTARDKKK